MSVSRRELVQWMTVGPMVWVALPGCRSSDDPKAGSGIDAECCDTPSPDTAAPSGTTEPGDSAVPTDTGAPEDSASPTDTAEPTDPAACAIQPDVLGPFYTPDAPEKTDLNEGDGGTPIQIAGQIVQADDCTAPLAGAVFDAWHANDAGEYDNEGFSYRGRFTSDAEGRFLLQTVLPGSYPDRPVRHIHFKIWDASGTERITSQLYFAGDERHNPAVHTGPVVTLDADGVGRITLGV